MHIVPGDLQGSSKEVPDIREFGPSSVTEPVEAVVRIEGGGIVRKPSSVRFLEKRPY